MSTLQIELFSKKESGLDGLRREDFPSEEAFVSAAIARQMQLNDPAYRKARIAVLEERNKQLREEENRRAQAENEAAVKACRLSKNQEAEVRKAAADKALRDADDRKIQADQIAEQTAKYVTELTEAKKREIVMASRINQALRGNRHRII